MAKTLIVIAGPTAIGKTTLAIKLAQHYHTEIISADSRQFYKEMEIGTAKPTSAELKAAKHHFINSHSITDPFSVGDFEREAIKLIEDLFKDHDRVILAGGSGLFINAVINGFDHLPGASGEIRLKLNELLRDRGLNYLQNMLKEVDSEYYDEVDINNPQRIIRALEVYETSGKPFSEFRKKNLSKRSFSIIQIGLNIERAQLYQNINKRVDHMLADGLLGEVERLIAFRHLNSLNTVGYCELFDFFDGKYSLEEAIEKIKQNTRRFAKRQLTWFNKSPDITWFDPKDVNNLINHLDSRLHYLEHAEQSN